MPQHHGRAGSGQGALQNVDVCAANPHTSYLQQNLVVPGVRRRSGETLDLEIVISQPDKFPQVNSPGHDTSPGATMVSTIFY